MKRESTRREFISAAIAAGTTVGMIPAQATWLETSMPADDEPGKSTHRLQIQPRYHRWHVDPGIEWTETNTGYATLDWSIPLSQSAIVLVDVWDHHYLKDTEARTEAVIKDKLLPLLSACRQSGMPIIHAPSTPQAIKHPNWVALVDQDQMSLPRADWPPSEFRSRSGPYRVYRRPDEFREPELVQLRDERQLHPLVQPQPNEAVVATGEELHRYCRQQQILFLFYVGFNTNACVLLNDYGTVAMSQRGYEVILVRDCTTGMESPETQATLSQTHGAVLFLEMFGKYSIATEEMISGLPGATA